MTGEIDSIIMSLFSLRERLFDLEAKLESYSSQQVLISLLVSFSVVLGFKVYDYFSFNIQSEEEFEEEYDEESDEEFDEESDEKLSIKTEKPLLYGCDSDSSGFDEN